MGLSDPGGQNFTLTLTLSLKGEGIHRSQGDAPSCPSP